MTATDWWEQAVCARVDPEVWFPASRRIAELNRAKELCADCPVRAQCLDEAMRAEGAAGASNRSGVFGGQSPTARRRLYETDPVRWGGPPTDVAPVKSAAAQLAARGRPIQEIAERYEVTTRTAHRWIQQARA